MNSVVQCESLNNFEEYFFEDVSQNFCELLWAVTLHDSLFQNICMF